MRILTAGNMYPPHYFGGYELLWQSWVRNARARGHDVRVLTTDTRIAGADGEGDPDVHRVLRWYWADHGWPETTLRERWAVERANERTLAAQLREFRPDVVCWWAIAGMSLSLLEQVRAAGLRQVGVVDDYYLEYGPDVDHWLRTFAGPRRRHLGRLVTAVTRRPTTVDLVNGIRWVFTSEFIRSRALARHPALRTGPPIPHPPPALETFARAEPRPWAWRLGYVGRVDASKGVDLAVDALAELPAEATLTVVGAETPGYAEELRARAGDRATFGRRPRAELPQAYADADVVVFPVRWGEPFGLVPLEAMAVGRPVVASGRGGSGEYLRDGENCLLFDPDAGPAALAAAVRRLADDPDLRARLRAGGFATVQRIVAAGFDDAVLEIVRAEAAA